MHLRHVFGRELIPLEVTVGGSEQIAALQLNHRTPYVHARDRLAPVVEAVHLSLGQREAVLVWTLQRAEAVFRTPETGLKTLSADVLRVHIEQQNAAIAKLYGGTLGDRSAAMRGTGFP